MALSRRDIIIAVIFTIILYGGIFGYVCIYPIIKFSGPSWPKIQDNSKLLQDCKSLLNENPDIRYYWSEIEDTNYPESVKALSPIGIHGDKEFVDIRISGGGIGPG